jgi:hypothetical protein
MFPLRPINRRTLPLLLALATIPLFAHKRFTSVSEAADSFQRKLEHVQQNSKKPRPATRPSVFLEEEINAYFSERRLPNMPAGVQSVRFELRPANVVAFTTVDFDELRRDRKIRNALLSIFTGTHDCEVEAVVGSAGPGRVRIRVDSVKLDGISIPLMAVDMFIDRFVNTKFPQVGLDREYQLPARIESAVIKLDQGVIVQR